MLGVEHILSASAVGSLKEEYKPLDIVVPDQFFDRTRGRISTFFGRGLVAHVAFAHPLCATLSAIVAVAAGRRSARPCTEGGTYVCMEGPQFSTLAESKLYRSWGMDIIGMTNLQEAKLAREAEICYATLALVTDYDCWHPDHDSVTVDMIIANLLQNAEDRAADDRRGRASACRRRGRARARTRWRRRSSRGPTRPGADQEGTRADHRQIHEAAVRRPEPVSEPDRVT